MTIPYEPYGITIDGGELKRDARDYELSVRWHLDLMRNSDTGSALLRGMQRTGKSLLIKPWRKKTINATTQALDEKAATARGEFAINSAGKPITVGRWIPEVIVGSGKGSNVEIRYAPNMFGYGGTSAGVIAPTLPGVGRTAVLFHEMAHAYRAMAGHRYRGPMIGARQAYDDEEEFFAIVLSNIFVTDATTAVQGRALRADHHGFTPLPTAQATSRGFLQVTTNKRLVGRLTSQEAALTNDLLAVNATFNPVLEFYRPAPSP